MIVQARIFPETRIGTGWTGTWSSGGVKLKVGDLVLVPTAHRFALVTVLAVGRTRKDVNARYDGPLKKVCRKANAKERRLVKAIVDARLALKEAERAVTGAENTLYLALRKAKP